MIMVPTFKRSRVRRLISWREAGYTQEQVASRFSLSRSTVARYERLYYKFGIEVFANG